MRRCPKWDSISTHWSPGAHPGLWSRTCAIDDRDARPADWIRRKHNPTRCTRLPGRGGALSRGQLFLCRAPHLCSAAEAVPTASPPATPAGVMMDTLRMAARRERRAGPCEGASLCLARVLWRASSAPASEQVACRLPARPPCPAHALAARCACGRGHLASRAAARRKQCIVARAHFIFHALLARVVQLLRCPALRALRWRRLRWLWLLSKGLPEGHGARRGREVVARPGAAAAAEV